VPGWHSVAQKAPGRRPGPSWVDYSHGDKGIKEFHVQYPVRMPKELYKIGREDYFKPESSNTNITQNNGRNIGVQNSDTVLDEGCRIQWDNAEVIHKEDQNRITRKLKGSIIIRIIIELISTEAMM
jgi:hypothetical protein